MKTNAMKPDVVSPKEGKTAGQRLARPIVAGIAAVLTFACGTTMADDGHDFRDRAKVVSSTPIYEQVSEPRRECRTEYESREIYRNDNNTGGAILGAVVGGLVGSTVGRGNGKVAAAAVGAATGAVVGDRWNDRGGSYAQEEYPVARCRVTENYRQELVGYDVTYRYNGRNFMTRLPYDPGEWLNLNVSVSVMDPARGRWNESRSHW